MLACCDWEAYILSCRASPLRPCDYRPADVSGPIFRVPVPLTSFGILSFLARSCSIAPVHFGPPDPPVPSIRTHPTTPPCNVPEVQFTTAATTLARSLANGSSFGCARCAAAAADSAVIETGTTKGVQEPKEAKDPRTQSCAAVWTLCGALRTASSGMGRRGCIGLACQPLPDSQKGSGRTHAVPFCPGVRQGVGRGAQHPGDILGGVQYE